MTSPCVPGDRQQDQFIFLNDLTAYCQNVRNLFQIKKQFTDDDVMNMNIPVFRGIHCETEKVHRMDVRAPSNGETGTSLSLYENSGPGTSHVPKVSVHEALTDVTFNLILRTPFMISMSNIKGLRMDFIE